MRVFAPSLLLLTAAALPAQFDLAPLFTDHMVLQRGKPVPVWGRAAAGTEISVHFGQQNKSTKTPRNGRWMVKLDPLKIGDGDTLTVRGPRTIVCEDILIGEVWICSGQSNMVWPLHRAQNARQAIPTARHPQVRMFKVALAASDRPQPSCKGFWQACTPEVARNFSGVAYFFGRKLHQDHKVPIGLVQTAWGGTRAEAWTSARGMRLPALQPIVEHWAEQEKTLPQRRAQFEKRLARWKEASAKAKQSGKKPPRRPRMPANPSTHQHRHTNLFNAMIHPLVPFAIRGAIWYQGESNVNRAEQYATLFPNMIRDWRQHFGQGDFPFLFVQLAAFRYGGRDPRACAELWEAQNLTTVKLQNTAMASAVDVGNPKDIHPSDKQTVGDRLAHAANVLAYGKQAPPMGPRFKQAQRQGSSMRLSFDFVGGGLTARGGKLGEFQICGEDKQFHAAAARIEGDQVVVTCEQVKEPIAVRYAWHDTPTLSLYNKAGLPATPFRTDSFKMVTAGKKKP